MMDRHFAAVQKTVLATPALNDVRLVTVTLDPEFDTPAVLKPYSLRRSANPAVWTFATGEPTEIARFASQFGLYVERTGSTAADIIHNLVTVVVDPPLSSRSAKMAMDPPLSMAGVGGFPRSDEVSGVGHAETAARPAAIARAERTGRVLEQRQVGQLVEAQRTPEQVDAEQQLRASADVDLRRIDVHRLRVDVDEHRLQPRERDDVRGRRERVGGHEHLVAGLQLGGEHRQVQRRRAGGDGERVLDLAGPRDLGLELLDLGAHREHAAREDLGHLGELGLTDVRPP